MLLLKSWPHVAHVALCVQTPFSLPPPTLSRCPESSPCLTTTTMILPPNAPSLLCCVSFGQRSDVSW